MSKIIIDIKGGIPQSIAIALVSEVVVGGRVSAGAKGKPHYCWHSCFGNGYCVTTRLKYGTDTDGFIVEAAKDIHPSKASGAPEIEENKNAEQG